MIPSRTLATATEHRVTTPSIGTWTRQVARCLDRDPRRRPGVAELLATALLRQRIGSFLTAEEQRAEFAHTVLHGPQKHIRSPKPNGTPALPPQPTKVAGGAGRGATSAGGVRTGAGGALGGHRGGGGGICFPLANMQPPRKQVVAEGPVVDLRVIGVPASGAACAGVGVPAASAAAHQHKAAAEAELMQQRALAEQERRRRQRVLLQERREENRAREKARQREIAAAEVRIADPRAYDLSLTSPPTPVCSALCSDATRRRRAPSHHGVARVHWCCSDPGPRLTSRSPPCSPFWGDALLPLHRRPRWRESWPRLRRL